jgi:hypothetical protein
MVPPRAPQARLRLETLEDRQTLGDALPLAAAALSAVGPPTAAEPGPAGGGLNSQTDDKAGGLGSDVIVGSAPMFLPRADGTDPALVRTTADQPEPATQSPTAGFDDAGLDAIGPLGSLPAGVIAAPAVVGPVAPPAAPRPHLPLTSSAIAAAHAGLPMTVSLGPVAPGLPATAQVSRLTAMNRNATTMSGGWNPALRGILVMNDGSRWFAAETGTDVQINSAMVYYKLGPSGWKAVGSVALPAGIQQNMATITDGRVIFSYGCTRSSVIEAAFDTARPGWNRSTSNAITTGGVPIDPSASANYVGAAWRNGTRVVWWTSVGAAGASGQWSYAFNAGRGWSGAIVSDLGGFNDVGYVRARFDDRGRLRLIGEGYVGEFPNGHKNMVGTTVTLGYTANWVPLLPTVARSPLDLWRGDAGIHYLYATAGDRVGYWFGAKGSKPMFFTATTARFIAAGDRLGLVLANRTSVEVRLVSRAAAAAGPIDWTTVPPVKIDLPAPLRAAGVSAIWTADESRQPHGSERLEFAVGGGYPARDNLIYYVSLDGGQTSRAGRLDPVRG